MIDGSANGSNGRRLLRHPCISHEPGQQLHPFHRRQRCQVHGQTAQRRRHIPVARGQQKGALFAPQKERTHGLHTGHIIQHKEEWLCCQRTAQGRGAAFHIAQGAIVIAKGARPTVEDVERGADRGVCPEDTGAVVSAEGMG